MTALAGILFDKDGTLFDFHATWSVWAEGLLGELAAGDAGFARRLGAAISFRFADATAGEKGGFLPASPVIAGTPEVIADALLPHLPGHDRAELVALMNARAALAPQMPAVPLRPLLAGLRGRGLRLGLATNDGEAPARAHLAAAGVTDLFDFVAGYDSGHGAKPEPGQLLAFARAFGLAPAAVLMVGDSAHDLVAGRRAGMRTLAVLTGLASAADLAPHADAVLPDIGAIPDWLAGQGA
ncbi:HAD family hydrolase [Phaeovulum sp.]|uniref:HAD family hydrolase n=1 Tax=Phaeovulum sp. TaxID=2934796 RepID=UPI002730E5B8|nr:HAD-IA family hydrolase [Phaeovulum sp.]MDP1667431.1 HAD-IA family hydrolase [Phaeovulum sp.]MDZ4119948.1 HAD-IA family hydrolase [Phaeovulum sp.]